MKKLRLWILTLALAMVISACGTETEDTVQEEISSEEAPDEEIPEAVYSADDVPDEEPLEKEFSIDDIKEIAYSLEVVFSDEIPAYSGKAYTELNNNIPFFATADLPTESFEYYSDLDELGRCGIACANIGQDIMPTEDRGSIGQIKPSGWHTVKYDIVDGKYLYNRCHLIGFQLSGENANEKNLITGTRYMNVEGMLPFENMVADYVKETGNHVLYRVAPMFWDEEDLVAYGVIMEGWSVEDEGDGICYNVFVYNVQPGVVIDYATGESSLEESTQEPEKEAESSGQPQTEAPKSETETAQEAQPQGTDYILNTNTKKFHYPTCSSVKQMKESNKEYFNGSRDEVLSRGYDPCKKCNP